MRIALLHEDYHSYYSDLSVRQLREYPDWNYATRVQDLMQRSFYIGDSYSRTLTSLGHCARDFVPAAASLQQAWAKENRPSSFPLTKVLNSQVGRFVFRNHYRDWLEDILIEQMRDYAPDVIYFFSGVPVSARLLRALRAQSRVLLQWTCPLRDSVPYESFDAIVSGSEELCEVFRGLGFLSAHVEHGFDPHILYRMQPRQPLDRALICGSLSPRHFQRIQLVEHLLENSDVRIHSPDALALPRRFRDRVSAPVFGLPMYELMTEHLVVIHHNIDELGPSVSAKRLYEAGGVGRVVLTNYQHGIEKYFDPASEIVTYRSSDECRALLKHLLSEPARTIELGKRAQMRVLRDHTLDLRMRKLTKFFENLAQ